MVGAVAKVQPLWALLRVQRPGPLHAPDGAGRDRRLRRARATCSSREQGRPRAEIAALELLAAIDALELDRRGRRRACWAAAACGTSRSLAIAKRARIAYEPFGVVGVIGAGSAPFAQPLGQIAGRAAGGQRRRLQAGRPGVPGRRADRAGARAGGPAGGPRAGRARRRRGRRRAGRSSPVDKVLFTGSPAVGRAVARACVSREKEVTVELGGKDAMLVLADANLPRAVAGALWAGCAGAGQARGSVERVYVAREVYEPLPRRPRRAARATDASATPPTRAPRSGRWPPRGRLAHVQELVDEAVAQGARLHCGGPVSPAGAPGGAFYAPAVLTGVTERDAPVPGSPSTAPCSPCSRSTPRRRRSRMANDSDYGLGASVWTADRYRGTRIARELHAGMVWLNDHLPGPDRLARAVGRRGRRRPRPHARPGRPAGLRPGEADHLGPARDARACGGAPTTRPRVRAARAVARLRSARESDRERAWRAGALTLVRLGARAFGRGIPGG